MLTKFRYTELFLAYWLTYSKGLETQSYVFIRNFAKLEVDMRKFRIVIDEMKVDIGLYW